MLDREVWLALGKTLGITDAADISGMEIAVTDAQVVVDNIASLISVFRGHQPGRIATDANLAYRTILLAVVGPDKRTTSRLAKRVQVDPPSTAPANAVHWRTELAAGKRPHFPAVQAQRSDKLPEATAKRVKEFWTEHTVIGRATTMSDT